MEGDSYAGKPRATWLENSFCLQRLIKPGHSGEPSSCASCRNPRQPQPSFSASSQTPHPQVHTLCIASFPSGPSSVHPGSSHLPILSITHLFCFLSPSRHTCTVPTLIQSFASSLLDLRKTPPTRLVYVTSLSWFFPSTNLSQFL